MKALASIFIGDDDRAWLVTATPSEAAGIVREGILTGERFVEFTLGNKSDWSGKPLYLDPEAITAISPPKSQDKKDEDYDEDDD